MLNADRVQGKPMIVIAMTHLLATIQARAM